MGMHDRKATEDAIITAVDNLISRKGFVGLGINAIAREAGISKVLIYRYFGDFDGLLEAWALKNSYWLSMDTTILKAGSLSKSVQEAVLGMSKDLMNQPVKREVLRWLLSEESQAGTRVMEKLEERGVQLTENFIKENNISPDLDMEALFAVLTAGINYLALLSDRADVYNGISLQGEEGWARIALCLSELMNNRK